ncbi:MAG: hypothetical protein PUC15_09780 [Lentisphaeria bacterium]|nr:hypothetical protein [Lentisphaeria bacterium]MDD6338655.1 hypothetical protein [Lentisphaeria bacterium]
MKMPSLKISIPVFILIIVLVVAGVLWYKHEHRGIGEKTDDWIRENITGG